jgi:hypothetical protein
MPRLLSRQKSRRDTNKMTVKSKSVDEEMTPDEKFAFLMAQNEELNKKLEALTKEKTEKKEVSQISPNEFIKVMSLVNNKLNLSTKPGRDGKHFGFDRYGEVKNILYSDLIEINNNQKNFLEAGYYYILDDRVIDLEGLNDIYDRILSKAQIEQILTNEKDAKALFQKTNPKQQSVIVKVVIEKMIKGENIDYNLVDMLTKVSGINIQEKVNTTLGIISDMEEENKSKK